MGTIEYRFSGHQTFVFRHGWLEKGVDLVRSDPRGFLADDAIVRLGVGKNMVEGIKYWCMQTGVLDEGESSGEMVLTDWGKFIFGSTKSSGADPYLEDEASLWLLHYNICTRAPESATSIVFNYLNKPEFTKGELQSFVHRRISGKIAVSDKTLARDVDCLIHSYAGTKTKNIEDSFDCPFLSLSLIQPTVDADLYRMNVGQKPTLPDEIIGYALLHQMHKGSVTVSLREATYAPQSPGQVFRLDEDLIVEAVERLEDRTNGALKFVDTAGLNSINFTKNTAPFDFARELVGRYYGAKK